LRCRNRNPKLQSNIRIPGRYVEQRKVRSTDITDNFLKDVHIGDLFISENELDVESLFKSRIHFSVIALVIQVVSICNEYLLGRTLARWLCHGFSPLRPYWLN